MRILHIIHDFIPEIFGGSETYLFHLAKEQTAHGHEVAILCRRGIPRNGSIELIRSQVEQLPVFELHQNGQLYEKGFKRFYSTFYNPDIDAIVKNILTDGHWDLIHIHSLMYLSAGIVQVILAQSIPYVVTLHDYFPICQRLHLRLPSGSDCAGPLSGFRCIGCTDRSGSGQWYAPSNLRFLIPFIHRNRLLRNLLVNAARVFLPSSFMKEILIHHGIHPPELAYLPYGVSSSLHPKFTYNKVPKRFGYVGSIKPHKGVHIALEAFNRVMDTDSSLTIYGALDETSIYGKHVTDLADNRVLFAGPIAHNTIQEAYSEIDCLLIPSLWRETGPIVALEAFASGIPVIGSAIGGLTERIHHEVNGLLFPAGNAGALSDCIHRLMEQAELYAHLVAHIEKPFTIEAHAQELQKHYNEVTNARCV